jgi:hypothetical protein
VAKATRANGCVGNRHQVDPIFAAIERHRAATRGWLAARDRRWALRKMIPEARRSWEFDEMPDRCTDAPEWIEANTALIEAYEELDKALEAVLSTPPTTIVGVADSLDYVSGDDESDQCGGTILENALVGDYNQGPVQNPACIVEGVRKAAALPAHDRRDLALTHGGIIMTDSTHGRRKAH